MKRKVRPEISNQIRIQKNNKNLTKQSTKMRAKLQRIIMNERDNNYMMNIKRSLF